MQNYFFEQALLPDGWAQQVRVAVENKRIVSVTPNSIPKNQDHKEAVVIPTLPNIHSHVFQRAMAGRSEFKRNQADDFWSWRELMYRLANELTAAQFYDIAKATFSQMRRAGYGHVCEFHYVHRDLKNPSDTTAQAEAILAAAADVDMPITLLPVLYSYAGFGEKRLLPDQQRFALSTDEYLQVYERLQSKLSSGQSVGICFHSLRAVSPKQMTTVLDALPKDVPVHLHIAEQTAEVEQCQQHRGQTPVAWLYEHFDVDSRWCLIHATHISAAEIKLMAQSKAIAGLCPLTEANLGDGLFPLSPYKAELGRWAIGSDSNIKLNPAEELQMLAYSQRLDLRQRVVCSDKSEPHAGSWLWQQALAGGAQAAGLVHVGQQAGFAVGQSTGFLALSENKDKALPSSVISEKDNNSAPTLLDRYIFSDNVSVRRID